MQVNLCLISLHPLPLTQHLSWLGRNIAELHATATAQGIHTNLSQQMIDQQNCQQIKAASKMATAFEYNKPRRHEHVLLLYKQCFRGMDLSRKLDDTQRRQKEMHYRAQALKALEDLILLSVVTRKILARLNIRQKDLHRHGIAPAFPYQGNLCRCDTETYRGCALARRPVLTIISGRRVAGSHKIPMSKQDSEPNNSDTDIEWLLTVTEKDTYHRRKRTLVNYTGSRR